ncbi:MAG: hypothetical protein WBP94_02460 [Rhodomicrobiaceae bacterium]
MDFIIKRLQEPSTYAGIAAFLAGFGLLGLTEQDWNQIFGALAALAGVVAIFVKEQPAQAAASTTSAGASSNSQ